MTPLFKKIQRKTMQVSYEKYNFHGSSWVKNHRIRSYLNFSHSHGDNSWFYFILEKFSSKKFWAKLSDGQEYFGIKN